VTNALDFEEVHSKPFVCEFCDGEVANKVDSSAVESC
jgi:hypothetical protein